nr:hypothetical protein ABT39_MTgene4374 [Picea glauca]
MSLVLLMGNSGSKGGLWGGLVTRGYMSLDQCSEWNIDQSIHARSPERIFQSAYFLLATSTRYIF